MASRPAAAALSSKQVEMLKSLFNELDHNGDGQLDVAEFKLFGKAISGRDVTDTQARMQLTRADKNRDESLDLSEFLAFSSMLANLPQEAFEKKINELIKKVRENKRDEKK